MFYSKNKEFRILNAENVGSFRLEVMNDDLGRYNAWNSDQRGRVMVNTIKELRELHAMLGEFLGEQ